MEPGGSLRVTHVVKNTRVDPAAEAKRDRIFRRDGYQCVYCGASGPEVQLTLDHVEPRMKGGDSSPGNLVTCCRACNAAKAGQAAWAWLATRSDLRAHFLDHATAVWPRLRRAIEDAAG